MITAFVAGATGYTGRAVVEQARRRGLRTVAHVRPDSDRLAHWQDAFATMGAEVDTTPWQPRAMAETMRRVRPDLVFSLLGTTMARARREGSSAASAYERVDHGMSVMLLGAVQTSGQAARFVYLSSAGVRERSRTLYAQTRWRVERAIHESGVPFTIARPSLITGPDRDESRPAERLGAIVWDGLLQIAAAVGARRLRERWGSTTNTALARSLVSVALDPDCANRIVESEQLRSR